MRSGLFGERPVGAVALVETPVSRSFARKARTAFIVVALAAASLTTAVLSLRMNLLLAIVLGVALGVVLGFVVAAVVRAWPVLRLLWHWSLCRASEFLAQGLVGPDPRS